ncbi:MAG: peptide-methionine (S)-S-oxide reductase MsrA [Candidatus Paceibacterota bacterium]
MFIILNMKQVLEIAVFAGGCFWGVQQEFDNITGVVETRVGYTGGSKENPTYEEVCTGSTGHTEAVEVTYDPDLVSYQVLLNKFWALHNPTTYDRQGPDVGSQYRSVIFYSTEKQKALAESSKEKLNQSGKFSGPVVTAIVPATHFWPAEDYHQKYNQKHGHTCGA